MRHAAPRVNRGTADGFVDDDGEQGIQFVNGVVENRHRERRRGHAIREDESASGRNEVWPGIQRAGKARSKVNRRSTDGAAARTTVAVMVPSLSRV